jgi:hypothetical protein
MLNPSTVLIENTSDPSTSTAVSLTNPLPILTRDFLINVGFGLASGYRRVAALGSNTDVDTGTVPEDIWPGGGVYPWMTAATALQIRSTSAQDAPGGTGIASVSISFLDATYAEEAAVVTTLNGVTAVPITGTHFRINAARPASKGSGAAAFGVSNVGDIIIEDVAGQNTIRAVMPANAGNLRQSVFTVPLGNTLQVVSQAWGFNSVAGGNRFAQFSIYIQGANGIYVAPLAVAVGDEPPYTQPGLPGIVLAEKTDFAYRCTGVSNDNTSLFAAWLGVMRLNTATS